MSHSHPTSIERPSQDARKESGRAREWIGLILGGIGSILGLVNTWQSHINAKVSQRIEVGHLLDDARDLMGGRSGVRAVKLDFIRNEKNAQNIALADRKIREALEIDSSCVKALTLLGVHWQLLGNLEEAEEVYKEAYAIDRSDPELLIAIGNLATERGDRETSARYYQAALGVSPKNPAALFNMGIYYWNSGMLEKAKASLDAAHDADPFDADTLATLAHLGAETQDWVGAASYMAKAIEIQDSESSYYSDLGLYSLLGGNASAAVDALARSIEINPWRADAHERIGNAYRKLNAHESAREHFRLAREIRSQDPISMLSLKPLAS